jgi:hypothetical protein
MRLSSQWGSRLHQLDAYDSGYRHPVRVQDGSNRYSVLLPDLGYVTWQA